MDLAFFVQAIFDNNISDINKYCDKINELETFNEDNISDLFFGLHYLIKYNYIEIFDHIFNKKLIKIKNKLLNYYNNSYINSFFLYRSIYKKNSILHCSILDKLNIYFDSHRICLLTVGINTNNINFLNKLFDYGFNIKITMHETKNLINQVYIKLLNRLYYANRYTIFNETTFFPCEICEYFIEYGITDSNEELCDQLLKFAFIRYNEKELVKKEKDNNITEIIIDEDVYITFHYGEDAHDPIQTIKEVKEAFKSNLYNYSYIEDDDCVWFFFVDKEDENEKDKEDLRENTC